MNINRNFQLNDLSRNNINWIEFNLLDILGQTQQISQDEYFFKIITLSSFNLFPLFKRFLESNFLMRINLEFSKRVFSTILNTWKNISKTKKNVNIFDIHIFFETGKWIDYLKITWLKYQIYISTRYLAHEISLKIPK